MLKKRIIITLTFNQGVLFRTKKFNPDYRYTKNFIDFWSVDELVLIDVSKKNFKNLLLISLIFFQVIVLFLFRLEAVLNLWRMQIYTLIMEQIK